MTAPGLRPAPQPESDISALTAARAFAVFPAMFNGHRKTNKTAQQAQTAIRRVASLQRNEQRIDEASRDTSRTISPAAGNTPGESSR
jgi:type IV secretory pathway TrbL component